MLRINQPSKGRERKGYWHHTNWSTCPTRWVAGRAYDFQHATSGRWRETTMSTGVLACTADPRWVLICNKKENGDSGWSVTFSICYFNEVSPVLSLSVAHAVLMRISRTWLQTHPSKIQKRFDRTTSCLVNIPSSSCSLVGPILADAIPDSG